MFDEENDSWCETQLKLLETKFGGKYKYKYKNKYKYKLKHKYSTNTNTNTL